MHELSVVCIGAARRGELRVKRSPLSQAARFKFQQISINLSCVCCVGALRIRWSPPPAPPSYTNERNLSSAQNRFTT